jgi:hypothetical protein
LRKFDRIFKARWWSLQILMNLCWNAELRMRNVDSSFLIPHSSFL